jgi:hypothetical protein
MLRRHLFETLRNNDGSSIFAQLLEPFLNEMLRLSINGAGGFIQENNIWAFQDSTGDCDALLFASGQFPGYISAS